MLKKQEIGNSKRLFTWLITIILFSQGVFVAWFCYQKEYYHGDEIATFSLANGYYEPFLRNEIEDTEWMDVSVIEEHIKTNDDTKFQYDSVLYNQGKDVHPPFYYLLIHTIFSIFSGQFSKWYGLSLNIFFVLLTNLLLYFTAKKIMKNKFTPLIAMLLFGFSIGAATITVFIRMYAMLTFFCILDLYLHICLLKHPERRKVLLPFVFCITIAGFLTHYYFLVFAFFLSLGYVIRLVYKRSILEFIKYAITRIGGLGASIVIFPSSLHHIFKGYRGKGTYSALTEGSYLSKLAAFYKKISSQLFADSATLILIVILILFVAATVYKCFVNHVKLRVILKELYPLISITMAVVGYFVIIAIISPFQADRYIFCIYPIVCLILCAISEWGLSTFFVNKKKISIVLLCCVIGLNFTSYNVCTVRYLYEDSEEPFAIETLSEYDGDFVVFYSSSDMWRLNSNVLFYITSDKVCFISETQKNDLNKIFNNYQENGIKVAIDSLLDETEILNLIIQETGFSTVDIIVDTSYARIYYIHD